MPTFDFACKDCGNQFDVMVSNADKPKVRCPECGSSNIQQKLSLFNTARTSGKNDPPESCHTCNNSGCPMRF